MTFVVVSLIVYGGYVQWNKTVDKRLDEMTTDIQAQESKINELATRLGGQLIALQEKGEALEQTVKSFNTDVKEATKELQWQVEQIWKKK